MSQMQPRQVGNAAMVNRVSDAAFTNHYQYAEAGVAYEQDFVTYEFFDRRGDLAPRERSSATMRGRLNGNL